ncbi:MAG: hypothetical protein HY272_10720 [Gammaproteobacteria bacterium]|nr:hypothetical protein [Gammaproteobacteria bacterium]
MAKFKCPRCKALVFSWQDKYRMGFWGVKHCSGCNARVAAFPWTLVLLSFLYVWNVVWWAALIHFNHSYHYLIFMALCWVLLDLLNVYFMPLASFKQCDKPNPS